MRNLIRESKEAANTTGDGILGQGWICVLAKLLEGGLLVLQTKRAGLEQMGGHVVAENFESAFDASTCGDGRAGRATQVRIVKVGQSVGAPTGLTALAPLLPRLEGLGGTHGGDQRADRVRIADGDAVGAANLLGTRAGAELTRAADHREGDLRTGARDLQRRRTSRFHERAAREEGATPNCRGLGGSRGDEHWRQAAHGTAQRVDEAREARELVGLVDDAHDVALAA